MATYAVLLYRDEQDMDAMTDAERADMLAAHRAFQAEHGAAIKAGHALHQTTTARSVAVADGSLAVTDGPFVETKEAIGGFYLIEADDLDAATRIARAVPSRAGGVEVRPVMVFE
jgi:hypothetical protein